MNTCLLGTLLLAYLAYIDCASIVGHGTDILGHVVPVKCTVNCEPQGPSVGPVVPHLGEPVSSIFPKSGVPVAPTGAVSSGVSSYKEAPVDHPVAAPATSLFDTTAATHALYQKGFYGGLGPSVHPYWGHRGALGHHGLWGRGLWGHHGVDHVDYTGHGLGGYAIGPFDVNGDGRSYTGFEDDRSPIVGGPVYHSSVGEARWHGPYQRPVVHAPTGGYGGYGGYGSHNVFPHHPWGHFAYGGQRAVAHPGIVTGHSSSGGVTSHGSAFGFRSHLPASTQFGVANAHDLLHRKHGDYTIGDIKGLKKKDCPPGQSSVLFDRSAKSANAEAAPVADAAPAKA